MWRRSIRSSRSCSAKENGRMKDASLCPRCGARLPTTKLGGLCPRCVGRGLLRAEPAVQVPGRVEEEEAFDLPDVAAGERKPGPEPVNPLKLDLADIPEEVIGQK